MQTRPEPCNCNSNDQSPAVLVLCRQQRWPPRHPEVSSRAYVLTRVVQRSAEQDGARRLSEELKQYQQARRSGASYEFPVHPHLTQVLGKAVCLYGFGSAEGSPHTVLAGITAMLSLVTKCSLDTAVPLSQLLPLLPLWLRPALEQPELREVLPLLLAHTGVTVYHPGWMAEQGGALSGRFEVCACGSSSRSASCNLQGAQCVTCDT